MNCVSGPQGEGFNNLRQRYRSSIASHRIASHLASIYRTPLKLWHRRHYKNYTTTIMSTHKHIYTHTGNLSEEERAGGETVSRMIELIRRKECGGSIRRKYLPER